MTDRVDSLAELIRRAIWAQLEDVHTVIPGNVHLYNSATTTAQIKLGIKKPIADEKGKILFEELPILQDVPIHFPRGGGYSITFPLSVGDPVLVFFSEVDAAQWLLTGQASNPDIVRRFNLGSAFAIPGINPTTSPLPAAADPNLVINGGEVKIGLAAVDYVAMNAKVIAELQSIATALVNHTHNYLPGPGSATATTTSTSTYSAPADVKSTKLKAE